MRNLLTVIYVAYFITINNHLPLQTILYFLFCGKSLTNYFEFIYLGLLCVRQGRPLAVVGSHAKGA